MSTAPSAIIIAILFAASAFLLAISLIPVKSDVSKRLEALEGLKWDQRSGGRTAALERLLGDVQRNRLERRLLEAGWYRVTPGHIAARCLGGGGLALSLSLAVATYLQQWNAIAFATIVLLTACGAYAPLSQLRSAMVRRKTAIQRGLPDLLDMLASTVQAGLAFNAALAYSIDTATGPLREEIQATLSEIRLGRSRADALKSMANRVRQQELSMTVTAIVQAERLGSNLANVLTSLADEARNKRMLRAEEVAAMMPVKMVLPMALFMLPALYVMIFGPVVANFLAK